MVLAIALPTNVGFEAAIFTNRTTFITLGKLRSDLHARAFPPKR